MKSALSSTLLLASIFSASAFAFAPTSTATTHGFRPFQFQNQRQATIQVRYTPLSKIGVSKAVSYASLRFGLAAAAAAATATATATADGFNEKLPSAVTPILLSVLALIFSEGIAISTLPLHLQSMGATPAVIGLSTSAFSIAQMVCCPLIVSLSSRIGRRKTLGLCLFGAALSSAGIACVSSIPMIIASRFLAGVFAAAIPVAQAGVTDIVPRHQAALALSRISAASQTGLVIGPIASAFIQGLLLKMGVSSKYTVRGVFAASSVFALLVLAVGGAGSDAHPSASTEEEDEETSETKENSDGVISDFSTTSGLPLAGEVEISKHPECAQPLLRIIALAAGWALTLSVSTYSLFSSRFLGYAQPQLSAVMSLGAATTIATQMLVVPRLFRTAGEHLSGTMGLWALTMGLAGTSLLRGQPLHTFFYLLIRVGTGISDTATATLVARYSNNREERARNLGMIQSTRAGARIFTPVVSGSLFARSCLQQFPLPGSLPYLMNAGLALALTPLPLVLKRMGKKRKSQLSGELSPVPTTTS